MARQSAVTTETRWTISEQRRNIHRIQIRLDRVGDEQRVLLMSDLHWDNPKCDRALLESHLNEAKAYHAPIIDNGDFYCAMQGKFDPRASKADLRPEHQAVRYLDALIDTSVEWWKPWAHLLTVRGQGNHETSILKRHETHLTERFVERMRTFAPNIFLGGYSGFVVFELITGTRRRSFKMHYHHGHGGGGPVTRGVIQTNRMGVYLADADIVLTGHTHDSWTVPIARVRLNQDCTNIEHVRQDHVRPAGYKQEYDDGHGGWHIERGGPPKPLGSWWLNFRLMPRNGSEHPPVGYDLVEAK